MGIERLGLAEDDVEALADATGRHRDEIEAELARRPWSILDLLSDPAVVAAALEPEDPFRQQVSPFLFFAVLAQKTADDIRTSKVINEWMGPSQRLPLFDVEPLREFADAPGRVVFVARLLTAFTQPVSLPVPANALDIEDLAGWLDAAMPTDRPRLFEHLGDLALFRAGVLADETGHRSIDGDLVQVLARQLDLDDDEVEALLDPASFSPGIDAMESFGPAWYRAARDTALGLSDRLPSPVVTDVASRFRPARRFLNHLADRYLHPGHAQIGFGF